MVKKSKLIEKNEKYWKFFKIFEIVENYITYLYKTSYKTTCAFLLKFRIYEKQLLTPLFTLNRYGKFSPFFAKKSCLTLHFETDNTV